MVYTLDDPSGTGPTMAGATAPVTYQGTFAPRRRRRRGPILWSVFGALVLAGAVAAGLVHFDASRSYDAALERVETAAVAYSAAATDAGEAIDDGTVAADAATSIVAAAVDPLVAAEARAGFAEAGATLTSAVASAQQVAAAEVPSSIGERPVWTWELLAAVPVLEDDAEALSAQAAELGTATADIEGSLAALTDSGQTLVSTVEAAATALEASNVSARAIVVLDFRDAADFASSRDRISTGAVLAFERYAAAAENLRASAKSELAEKAGPLRETRLEIEEYARSIAGGVVLDFDWAPLVNGLGGAYGMSGTATWNTVRGGFSTITLSDSVAENWPSADAVALVAHEVGHSITSKCSDLFDSEDADANEEWATAWAISMGHTAEGNGVQAYGYPSQEMIDVAATCR